MRRKLAIAAILFTTFLGAAACGQEREALLEDEISRFAKSEDWVYDDVEKGLALAKESGKPAVVVFRCVL